MSISVDDLASSFSSSHIGQEALDLAALQAQLAETLFGQSVSHTGVHGIPCPTSYAQPCNTPTASSSGFSWGQVAEPQRQGIAGSNWGAGSPISVPGSREDMEADEQAVADLLMSSSPLSATPATSYFSPPPSSQMSQYSPSKAFNGFEIETSPSFTSADPFYLAQAQASQNFTSPPSSAFAQYGHLPQHSPFMTQQYQQPTPQQNYDTFPRHPAPPHLSLDTHALFAATAATFSY